MQVSFFSHRFVEVDVDKQSTAWLTDRRREGKHWVDRAGVDKGKRVLLSPAAHPCHHNSGTEAPNLMSKPDVRLLIYTNITEEIS